MEITRPPYKLDYLPEAAPRRGVIIEDMCVTPSQPGLINPEIKDQVITPTPDVNS